MMSDVSITTVPETVSWDYVSSWHVTTSHGIDLFVINRDDDESRRAYKLVMAVLQAQILGPSVEGEQSGSLSGDLADERWPVDGGAVDMRQVLPAATLRELTTGAGAVLELAVARGADVERQAAWVAAWIAPLLAVHGVEHQDVQQAAQLADLRLQLEQARAQAVADAVELAELREQVASTGRGMSRLLGELAEAREAAGLDGAS